RPPTDSSVATDSGSVADTSGPDTSGRAPGTPDRRVPESRRRYDRDRGHQREHDGDDAPLVRRWNGLAERGDAVGHVVDRRARVEGGDSRGESALLRAARRAERDDDRRRAVGKAAAPRTTLWVTSRAILEPATARRGTGSTWAWCAPSC